ncbi:MAG: 3'(2'),5'-bisphosphate nucleotidase CysQ [Eubacteriales bacterium]
MKIDLKAIETTCCEVAVQAGLKIMEIYKNEELFTQVEYKSDDSPLTLADKAANDIIVARLRKEFPEFAILSEEERDNLDRLKNPYCFIVDPLDGTKEFVKRNGQFTVNIALSYEHRSILGVIYVPATGELYYASKGNGSYYKGVDDVQVVNQVSKEEDLSKVRLVMSGSHGCKEMEDLIEKHQFQHFLRMGSSLKGCLVAKGEAEIYYRHNPTMEWDTAAMQCIAEEAGAIFKQMDDSEMLYNRENSLNEKGFYIINTRKNRI